jgi:Protein of unknown function (DUF3307)
VTWVEVFAVFVVSHLAGDFLLQTDWQAQHKRGGLGPDPVSRRALISHVASYGIAFVPAFIWLIDEIGLGATLGIAALVLLPHLVQDDGRLLMSWVHVVKRSNVADTDFVYIACDQSFHVVALMLVSLLAAS